jgi:hypothetical protein
MSHPILPRTVLLPSLGLLLLASSCKSTGVTRTEAKVESMSAAAASVEAGKKSVNEVITAMDGVAAPGADLKVAFGAYVAKYGALESARATAESRAASMKARAKEYLDGWAADLEKLEDPDLKLAAKDRRAQAEARLEKIRVVSDKARAAYDTFHSRLTSLKSYLENDLNPDGVKGAAPTMAKAKEDAAALIAAIDAVLAELQSSKGAIAPPAPSPTTPAPKAQ